MTKKGDSSTKEKPTETVEELTKNLTALKEPHEGKAVLDIFVCGYCHSAFHFIEEFNYHKNAKKCTKESRVRNNPSMEKLKKALFG